MLLCVALTIATSWVYTLAFFGDSDSSDAVVSMGGPVVVKVADSSGVIANGAPLSFNLPTSSIIPGSLMKPSISAVMLPSSTAAVLRASFSVIVSGVSVANKNLLESALIAEIKDKVNKEWGFNASDNWFYFLGSSDSDPDQVRVMVATAESSGLTEVQFGSTFADYDTIVADRNIATLGQNTVMASVYSGLGQVVLRFLKTELNIPFNLTDTFSGAQVHFLFTVQALQDFLVTADDQPAVLPTIANFNLIEL